MFSLNRKSMTVRLEGSILLVHQALPGSLERCFSKWGQWDGVSITQKQVGNSLSGPFSDTMNWSLCSGDPTTLSLETYWSSAGNGKPPSAGPVWPWPTACFCRLVLLERSRARSWLLSCCSGRGQKSWRRLVRYQAQFIVWFTKVSWRWWQTHFLKITLNFRMKFWWSWISG